jgi:hypothetical protein
LSGACIGRTILDRVGFRAGVQAGAR